MRRIPLCLTLLAALLLTACHQHSEEPSPQGSATFTFHISNLQQVAFPDEGTRATEYPIETLPHVACIIYDQQMRIVGQPRVQDSDEEDYGTFQLELPYGQYTAVFVGYDRDCTLQAGDITHIGFQEENIPQTFHAAHQFTVSAEPSETESIHLSRIVSRLELICEDALPQGLATMTLSIEGCGLTFDGRTGRSTQTETRTNAIQIPKDYIGYEGTTLYAYCFLPQDQCQVNIKAVAQDAQGGVIRQRSFPGVTMRVNQILRYSGCFFGEVSETNTSSHTLLLDYEWEDPHEVAY